MLRRIGLQNFKCWRELDVELAPITLFFGVNSSGKSSLLQSLLMLKQTAQAFDPGLHINFGGGPRDFADFGSYEDLVFSRDLGSSIGLGMCWDASQNRRAAWFPIRKRSEDSYEYERFKTTTIDYNISWRYSKTIRIEELSYEAKLEGPIRPYVRLKYLDKDRYSIEIPEPEDRSVQRSFRDSEDVPWQHSVVRSPASCYELPKEIDFKYGIRGAFFSRQFESLMNEIHYLGPLRRHPQRHYLWTGGKPQVIDPDGGNAIESLIASEQTDRSLLSKVAGQLKRLELVDSFNVKPIDSSKRLYEIKARITNIDSSLVDVGFGVSQVLPVVTLLMSAPVGSIILLEQPELHLHPNAQATLADLMLFAAESRNLQLIVESHSENILRRIQRRIAEAESKFAAPDNVRAYFCVPTDTGSDISEVELDRFGQIANWPDKFLGDISGDLHTMAKAAIRRRRQELASE